MIESAEAEQERVSHVRQPGFKPPMVVHSHQLAPRAFQFPALLCQLERATVALSTYSDTVRGTPGGRLFLRAMLRAEAVASAAVDGAKCTVLDVLSHDAHVDIRYTEDAHLAFGVVRALNRALTCKSLEDNNLALLRLLYGELISATGEVPDDDKSKTLLLEQNSDRGENSTYFPPSSDDMHCGLQDLAKFIAGMRSASSELPLPYELAVAQGQFERIRPFPVRNGTVGRMIPPAIMTRVGLPPLFMSGFIRRHKEAYSRALSAVHSGDWLSWLSFFLEGISASAESSIATLDTLERVGRSWTERIASSGIGNRVSPAIPKLIEFAIFCPVFTIPILQEHFGLNYQMLNGAVTRLQQMGVLISKHGEKRNRTFFAPDAVRVLAACEDIGSYAAWIEGCGSW